MTDKSVGKVALVAGGTGGLGRAVTLRFLEDSFATIVPYRAQEEFAALKKAAEVHSWSLEGDVVDVTNEARCANSRKPSWQNTKGSTYS
jgi:NAD(P)-dependent dehydrogenase (short-subunit alcohol dehydrogenase family)